MILTDSTIKKALCYSLVIFILWTSCGASPLASSKPLAIGAWVLFSSVFFYYEKHIRPTFILILSIFITMSIVYYLRNDDYNLVTYLGLFIQMTLAYYCKELCKKDFADYLVTTMYMATCISFVMYAAQLSMYETFYSLNNFFGGDGSDVSKANSLIFTTAPIHRYRNCGFTWEPGGFAVMLIFTLFINLFERKEPLSSKYNIVFFVALLTTQSTMGFLTVLIPLGLVLKDVIFSHKTYRQLSIVLIPSLLGLFALIFFNTEFLYKKMVTEIVDLDSELEYIEIGRRDDFVVALSRSATFVVDMNTIKKYPILGLGVDYKTVSFEKLGIHEKLDGACGTSALLLRFGLVGLLVYTILLYVKAPFERLDHRIGWVLVVHFILFSQAISETAFFNLFIF
jgi:hypothetical protein